jgi:hypothetical protein
MQIGAIGGGIAHRGQAHPAPRRGHHHRFITGAGPGPLGSREVGGAVAAQDRAGRTCQGHGVKLLAAGPGPLRQPLFEGAPARRGPAPQLSAIQAGGQA